MREILFRAKRIDNGEWVYWNLWGELIRESGKRTRIVVKNGATTSYYDYAHQIRHLIDESTVSQYIGLCDKNGRKIFENDIIKYFWNNEENIDVVKYEAPIFTPSKSFRWSIYKDEVIGNVFDNPELLEGN